MAAALEKENGKAQFYCLLTGGFLALTTGMQHASLARDPCVESIASLLPPFGVALLIQATSVLAFLVIALWTGKLYRKGFVYVQVVHGVSCVTYAYFHWPSMAGLGIGTIWSGSVACNMWRALDHLVKAEKAILAEDKAWWAQFRDSDDARERTYWTEHEISSWKKHNKASSLRCENACFMISSFFGGTLGFVSAYLSGTVNIALKSFSLGFLGILVVALMQLEIVSDKPACSLTANLKTWRAISGAFLTLVAISCWRRDGDSLTNGLLCVINWSFALHTGIGGILETTVLGLENELGDGNDDDGDADGRLSDVSDSWEVIESVSYTHLTLPTIYSV